MTSLHFRGMKTLFVYNITTYSYCVPFSFDIPNIIDLTYCIVIYLFTYVLAIIFLFVNGHMQIVSLFVNKGLIDWSIDSLIDSFIDWLIDWLFSSHVLPFMLNIHVGWTISPEFQSL